ncbi:MAG: hemagglutinin [Bifidobacterium sp.]|nr:hemagglutinin [Bifidobacterium tibiigranuli]MCH3974858.1 hemagglutinin [Bifidobacterium tibiigranuli]MCH4190270.1 hemagglutinin [Bifidobacterium tibiigranuli]MCH4202618.1 hemagglutinin [Bifidobacterium tibiigranuli]MCH4273636.1 hemagglutinin [Bifidobacterium tibiigranuli]MCI1232627.1 hemagglutinin [Bifidobacterium tibiigranuli]
MMARISSKRPQTTRRPHGNRPHGGKRRKLSVAQIIVSIVAAFCALVLIMGLVRFVQWQHEISTVQNEQAAAARQYGFNPGDIISDGQFFNSNAMSQAEVQSFIDEQGASCSGTRCLKSMTFDTANRPADGLCSAYAGVKGESAAAIIDKSARACGLSQKVLLTMLQKEQQLVSASNPTAFQYKAAMGLNCPDDASCDPAYAGFFNQVYGAAKRYQYYRAHEADYHYHAKALNYVAYHPNASCGGSPVYIENEATALLYIYTPYQPNAAALQAGDGEGDACSSYGNRNFSIIYRGWFGNKS